MSMRDKKQLATLIYYPEAKLELIEKDEEDIMCRTGTVLRCTA